MSPVEENEFKKAYGAYYTPNVLATELTSRAMDHMISSQTQRQLGVSLSLENLVHSQNIDYLQAILSYIPNITILDGSLGQGEFLLTTYNLLQRIYNSVSIQLTKLGGNCISIPRSTILNNLYGMEIDSGTLRTCRRILEGHSWNIENKILSKWMKNNLVVGNFLNCDFNSWKMLPEKFSGFDLIIGNPPWGSQLTKEARTQYYNKFDLTGSKRNLNSFELFVYQSTILMKPNIGYMALFLPKNLTRSNQYVGLRKFILHNYKIKSLFFHELFEAVTQEFISIVAQASNQSSHNNEIQVNEEDRISQKMYLKNTDYIFTFITDKSSLKLLEHIKNFSKPLDEYIKIQRGEELSKKGGVMYCSFCELWVPLSSRKPSIECSHCHEILDKSQLSTKFLISPKKTSEHPLPILTGEDCDHYFIKSSHYFNDDVKFKSKKDRSMYSSPKIVVQKIKQFPCAAMDENNTRTTQNVYNLRLKEQWDRNPTFLYYFLAILNSRLIKWYYENQFNLGSKYTNAISIKNLKRIPVRPPEKNERIVRALEKRLKKTTYGAKPSNSTIKEIDQIIMELYDCSSHKEFLEGN